MRINTNVGSLNAWRNLSATDGMLSKNLERLSSGYRINRAGDDVAGLAISENMRAQIRGLNQAIKNAQDGISLLQTAEGSLNEVHSMLHRMRELAVQSANGTLQPEDRKQIQTEMDNLAKEVTRITNATQFNSMDLIDGSLTTEGIRDVNLQIGPNGGQTVAFEIGRMDAKSLGISRDVMAASVYKRDPATLEAIKTGNFIASVDATGAIGAGVAAGEYSVVYDNTNETVQLFKGATSVGTAVTIRNSDGTVKDSVAIGDDNTAETMTVNLNKTGIVALAAKTTDYVMVGSRSATASETAANQTIVGSTAAGSTGISAVGWGLQSGDYQIQLVDADTVTAGFQAGVQLFDSTGTKSIGNAVNITTLAAGSSVQIGDKATGRTVDFTLKAAGASYGAAGTDNITVINNGQAAEDAKFDGHVKYANSQAFAGLNVSSVKGAQDAISTIDKAIGMVSYQRSQMGAITNRLEHTISNLQVVSENLTASESRIRDVDMALEMTQFTKQQILMQSGTAMLAQANQKNQAVLSLLR